jgi:hypothetical protein
VASGWGLQCGKCESRIARHSHLMFLRENDRIVHLVLTKALFEDEQELAPVGEERDAWSVRSADGEARVTKVRTTSAKKRARFPFELRCAFCDADIGSVGFLGDLTESVMALSAKYCTFFFDQAAQRLNYDAWTGPRARKWTTTLKKLEDSKLPMTIYTIQEFIDGAPGNGTQGAGRDTVETAKAVDALVFPTEESIRAGFSAAAKMTTLRAYQVELTLSALLENTSVYLPTGVCYLMFRDPADVHHRLTCCC